MSIYSLVHSAQGFLELGINQGKPWALMEFVIIRDRCQGGAVSQSSGSSNASPPRYQSGATEQMIACCATIVDTVQTQTEIQMRTRAFETMAAGLGRAGSLDP